MSELKRFKTCTVYSRVRPFWIYTTVSFFKKKKFSHLLVGVLKIFSILKKKKKEKRKKKGKRNDKKN